MTKFDRKIKRQEEKQRRKQSRAQKKDMAEKMGLFNKLEENCEICNAPFDKSNKEMVQSWYVIVREEQQKVNLYCPPCWESAQTRVREIQQLLKEGSHDH